MSEEATPAVQPDGTTPAAPAATPSNPQPEEKVTLDKKAHDQLVRDAARAGEAQSRADRFERVLKDNGLLGGGHFKKPAPTVAPSPEQLEASASEEDHKAERGLLGLAINPEYRDVLDKDPTLKELLIKNPLAVLSILAPEALYAEDAISLVKGALDKRKSVAAAPILPVAPITTPPAPPSGGVNPTDIPVNEEVESARKLPNTEHAIAGMIKARTKSGKK